MRRLLILGAGINQAPLYRTARSMGLFIVAIDPNASAPAFGLADSSHVCDLGRSEECLRIAKASDIQGVMTIAADFPVPTLARIADALCLKGPTVESALLATDKRRMRQALLDAGVPSPRSLAARSLDEASEAAGEIGRAVVLKPASSSGGRGITVLPSHSPADRLREAFEHSLQHAPDGTVLVEEFAPGPEYSVECLTHGGLTRVIAITDKLTSGEPHFVELGHSQPAQLPAAEAERLRDVASASIEALGIDDSASHVEVRLSEGGPRVIEAAARLGGGFIASHLVQHSNGVDYLRAAIQVALGDELEVFETRSGASAVRFIVAEPGVVRQIEGIEEAERSPGVVEATLYVGGGDCVQRLTDATARLGHVICSGSTAGEAISRAEDALHRIHVTTS